MAAKMQSSRATTLTHEQKVVRDYHNLPAPILGQIKVLSRVFANDARVQREADYNIDKYRLNPERDRDVARGLAILHVISTAKLLRRSLFDYVYAFDERGNFVKLEKIISSSEHVCLVKGQLYTARQHQMPVVLKWYVSRNRDITFEIEIYRHLRDMGCPIPWVATEFFLWTHNVLILEQLEELTKEDNEFVVGIQILQQLRYLHQFGVHSDIKPGNIMHRKHRNSLPIDDDNVTQVSTSNNFDYYLIDHGGDSLKRYMHGYERHCWTPRWCSQPRRKSDQQQVTTAKNDFLELGYTMKTFHCWRTGQKQVRNKRGEYIKDPFRSEFDGVLGDYMNYVYAIDETKISPNAHLDLIHILQKAILPGTK